MSNMDWLAENRKMAHDGAEYLFRLLFELLWLQGIGNATHTQKDRGAKLTITWESPRNAD